MGILVPLCLSAPATLQAQVVPDRTLNTQVSTSDNRTFTILDCLQVGRNVFHSFEQFSLPTGGAALFELPATVQNVFARVTGAAPSTIDGLIRAEGTANVFLLNPNGIQFGPNASLGIGGSFLASTADGLVFEDGNLFSAADPMASPLLSMSAPVGLQSGSTPQPIGLQDTTLTVKPRQTLALVGGAINLSGGQLNTPQGQINLIAASSGNMELAPTSSEFLTGSESTSDQGTIDVSEGAVVNVSGPGGGSINLQGQTVRVRDAAQLRADTQGAVDGLGITLSSDRIQIANGALLSASTFGAGAAGDITIQAQDVEIQGNQALQDFLPQLFEADFQSPEQFGTGLFSLSFGSGAGGQISITAEMLRLSQGSFLATSTFEQGAGGNARIQADTVRLDGAEIQAESFGVGNAGSVNLAARNIILRQGGGIFASTFGTGRGGLVNLRASNRVDLAGTTPNGRFVSGIGVNSFGQGNGGLIQIEAPEVVIREGAGAGGVAFDSGAGGTLIIRASEQVTLQGVADRGRELSSFSTRSQGAGRAGDIEITTPSLLVQDGATVSTSAQSSGPAGRLTIRASRNVTVEGGSADGRFSSLRSDSNPDVVVSDFRNPTAANVSGRAGDLTILTPSLEVQDGAEVSVSNAGAQAGNLQVQTDRLRLANRGFLRADSSAGSGGNISVEGRHVQLQNNSGITTNAIGTASGGNIQLDIATLVALENSDITANAIAGRGGNINITTEGLLLSPNSDITTQSQLGVDGEVTISTPGVDPSDSTFELSERIAIPPKLAQRCRPGQALGNGQFVYAGRGGLPPHPNHIRSTASVWHDLRQPDTPRPIEPTLKLARPVSKTPPRSIVEAQGWVKTAQGIALVSPPQARSVMQASQC